MLNYAIFIQTKQKLLDMTELTKKLSQVSGSFFTECINYLNDFQDFAQMHNLYFASDISLAVGKLVVFNPAKLQSNISTRHNLKKDKDAFAVECLNGLHTIIKQFLEKDYNVFEECANVWRQILSRILAKGYGNMLSSADNRIETVISIVKSDEEFVSYYSHLLGLIGIYNAKAVLDTVFPQLGIK